MKSATNGKIGFTLTELIMVISVLGILAGVAIPKFVSLTDKANGAACDGSVAAINAAILAQYAIELTRENPVPNWMERIDSIAEVKPSWFADGKVPSCPLREPYKVINGVCQKHLH